MSNPNDAPGPAKKFVYPFPIARAAAGGSARAQTVAPRAYYQVLARAEDGFFPIGANGQWHGGIHFGRQTGNSLAQDDGVHCIADGEVIAWKIDDEYPTVEYESCGAARYSTGFVLIRHRLQLPRGDETGVAASSQDGRAGTQEPSLTIYSLYMHLLDWKGYQANADKPRPVFWGDPVYLVGEQARDSNRSRNPHIPEGGVGLNLRDAANAIIGFAPRQTRLRLGERRGTSGYYAVSEVISGELAPPTLAGAYAFKDELTALPVEPPTFDEVVVPDAPIPIAAGDLVGHLGQYQRYIDMNPLGSACNERELLQVDVFTTEDITTFISQSQQRAPQLADSHKTLLLVDRGARLVQVQSDTPTGAELASHMASGNGSEVAHPRVLPVSTLGEAVTEQDGTRWWRVDAGNAEGNTISGWARESGQANVRLCTPWDWPGFETVDAGNTRPDQLYANHIVRQGAATQAERGELEQRGSGAESNPLFRRLYELIDLDDDRKVVPSELRNALAKPWLAQAISHLIVKHPSEWSGPMDRWDAINDLIPEHRKKDWEKEKERIESLIWWSEVKGRHRLPDDETLTAYTLHPVGLIGNFAANGLRCRACNALITLTTSFLKKIAAADATDAFLSEMSTLSGSLFSEYGVDTCTQVKHLLAQAKHETHGFASFRESLYYKSYTAESLYAMAPTAINNGFARKGMTFPNHAAKLDWIRANLLKNDAGYGEHCFGSNEQPGKDFRGRGLLQLTHYETYERCARETGHPIDSNPELVESDPEVIIETSLWFWKDRNIGAIADNSALKGDAAVKAVTRPINPAYKGLSERQQFKREISAIFNHEFNSECTSND